jgi:hypothetical protein
VTVDIEKYNKNKNSEKKRKHKKGIKKKFTNHSIVEHKNTYAKMVIN